LIGRQTRVRLRRRGGKGEAVVEHICSGAVPWSCDPLAFFDAEVELVCHSAILEFEAKKKVATHENIQSGLV